MPNTNKKRGLKYPDLMALAITDYQSEDTGLLSNIKTMFDFQADSMATTFDGDLSALLIELERSKYGRVAAQIIRTALKNGYSETAAVSVAVIAAAESGFDPEAINELSNARGYFQLVKKYWKTSAFSMTDQIVSNQLAEIAKAYPKAILDDGAAFYGMHLLPGLGTLYSKAPSLGIQAGTSTYGGQYAIKDSLGSVFHSPVLMFLFARRKFEALTGVLPEYRIPKLPQAVTVGSLSGRTIYSHFETSFPLQTTSATSYQRAGGAAALQVSFQDVALVGDEKEIGEDTVLATDRFVKYRAIPSEFAAARRPGVDAYFDLTGFDFESFAEYPENLYFPSLETLVVAVRAGKVDLDIVASLFVFACTQAGKVKMFKTTPDRSKSVISEEYSDLIKAIGPISEGYSGTFPATLLSLNSDEIAGVMAYLLRFSLESMSHTMHGRQVCLHEVCLYEADLYVGDARDVEGLSHEQYKSSFPWLLSNDVLYPFSLLVTPAHDQAFSDGGLQTTSQSVSRLLAWLRQIAPVEDGEWAADILLRKCITSGTTTGSSKKKKGLR